MSFLTWILSGSARACAMQVFILTILFSAIGIAIGDDGFDYTCFHGISPSAGVTLPRGDIELLVQSEPIELLCLMNPDHKYYKDGYRSSDLLFYSTERMIELESEIVNETTIRTIYDPKVEVREEVQCKIRVKEGLRGICTQQVAVGHLPDPPENFSCISENWENLNCTWDVPDNPVKTRYALSYFTPGRFSFQHFCPNHTGPVARRARIPKNTCFLGMRTHPQFRPVLKQYQFLMNVTNSLSNDPVYIKLPINTSSVVRPASPEALMANGVGPHQLFVKYNVPMNLLFFPPGLFHKYRYKSEFDDEWTEVEDLTKVHTHVVEDPTDHQMSETQEMTFDINGLLPYAKYTIEVQLLSQDADPTDTRLWSVPGVVNGRTMARTPNSAPRTAMGSFEIIAGLQERTIFVYWRQIDRTARNGPDFRYRVTEVFEKTGARPLVPSNVTDAYAEFNNLSLNSYTFWITSENSQGTAPNASRVFVPNHDKVRVLRPRSFTKIAYSDDMFEVSWLPPVNQQDVVNYTVFYCLPLNGRDRPYQCAGQLFWEEVDRNTHSKNITLPTSDLYQFAVAANTKDHSSGMVWATCTIIHNRVVSKLKTVSVDIVKPTSMTVRWRLDCSDRVGIVTGYQIDYCAVDTPVDSSECLRKTRKSLTVEADKEAAVITGLDPWTYYKVGVSVLTRGGIGEMSDYIVNRTRQDRPGSPPVNLIITSYGSNDVSLDWLPPVKANGPIYRYDIRYSYLNHKGAVVTRDAETTETSVKLNGLVNNAEYDVLVKACTKLPELGEVTCGEQWAQINFKTDIGVSGRMPAPKVTFINSTEVSIEWDDDFHHGGPIAGYEIRITRSDLSAPHFLWADGPRTFEYGVHLDKIEDQQDWSPDCTGNSTVMGLYNFTIRAVTENSRGNTFKGKWSPVETVPGYCKAKIPWTLIIIIVVCGPVSVLLVSMYFCRGLCWWSKNDGLIEDIKGKTETKVFELESPGVKGLTQGSAEDKKNVYQRSGSKDSMAMQTLLQSNGPKRNVSGNSDTTSGCVSGGSSESGTEEDKQEDKEPYVKVAAPANRQPSAETTTPSAYVPAGTPSPLSSSAGYLMSSIGSSQINNASWDQPPSSVPLGYSRVAAEATPISRPKTLDYVIRDPIVVDPAPPKPESSSSQRSTANSSANSSYSQMPSVQPSNGYVTFSSVREGSPLPPPRNIPASPPPSKGYITLAQANKQMASPADTPSDDDDATPTAESMPFAVYDPPPFAYSKVGVRQKDPSYVDGSKFGLGPGYSNVVGGDSWADKVAPRLDKETSPSPGKPLLDPALTDPLRSPSHGGYVQVQLNDNCQNLPDNLVMSPKSLQVEAKSPYHKVVTSLKGGKSSMV